MKFISSWTFPPGQLNPASKRFLETGCSPPEGVKMLGRWHAVGGEAGFGVAEADDPASIQKWVLQWSDLMTMQVQVALTDEQMAPLLAAAAGK